MHTLWPAFAATLAVTLTIGAAATFYHGGYLCLLIGHAWDLEPPWSGKELRHNPQCQRCDHEPVDIAMTGSHGGEHRV